MSSGNPDPNPFADPRFSSPGNPYQAPAFGMSSRQQLVALVSTKVRAPGIALIAVSLLGLAASVFNTFYAVAVQPPQLDPNAPEIVKAMQQGSVGPVAATVQGLMILLNLVILGGGIQIVRFQTRIYGIVASILSMLNIGTFRCLLGLPVGIWSLVILLQGDVARAFDAVD